MGKLRGVLALEEVRMTRPHLTREREGEMDPGEGDMVGNIEKGETAKHAVSQSSKGHSSPASRDPMWSSPSGLVWLSGV